MWMVLAVVLVLGGGVGKGEGGVGRGRGGRWFAPFARGLDAHEGGIVHVIGVEATDSDVHEGREEVGYALADADELERVFL